MHYWKRILTQIFSWICSNKLLSFNQLFAPIVNSAGPWVCIFTSPALLVSHVIPSPLTVGRPSCKHLSTPPSTGMPCGRVSNAIKTSQGVPEQGLFWEPHLLAPVIFSKWRPEGKPALLQWSENVFCRNLWSVVAKNLSGQRTQWTVYRQAASNAIS